MKVKISGLLFGPVKYLFLMSILLLSCSKIIHKKSTYSGVVTNGITGDPYEGALIVLKEYKFKWGGNSIGGGSTETVASTYSDQNGNFELEFDTKEAGKYTYDLWIIENLMDGYDARIMISQKNEDYFDLLFVVAPGGSITIKTNRALLNNEFIDFYTFNNIANSDIKWHFKESENQYQDIFSPMGTWTINYKYDSDGDTTVWDWEKTDTFWVEEGQTTEFVIDVDG